MKKKLFLLFLISVSQQLVSMNETNPQKILYQAIKEKKDETVLYALKNLKASPTFVIAIDGTRTVKQINVLNFALHLYEEKQDGQLISAILSSMTPKDFDKILSYEDQNESQTPADLAEKLFPNVDVYAWLGGYIKRSHFSADFDELGHEAGERA